MADPDRATAEFLALCDELAHAPHAFNFFHALRRLECAAAERPRLGESARAHEDPVRLGQTPSLNFASRTINRLVPATPESPPRLEVLFLGLFGPQGPLPLHLTEYARDRLRHHNDPTFARFADVLHHRLLSLFYRAWANAQPTVNRDRPESDRFAISVGALFGLAAPTLQQRDTVPDDAKRYYAGLLSAGPRHPSGLQAMLADFFGLPVRLEEFVGRWTDIPPECRCVLSPQTPTARLGVTTTVGTQVWDCQQTFRISLGPLAWSDYRRLLPGGDSLAMLADLVRNYLGDELLWELQLILQREQAPSVRLGSHGQLGWNSWLEPASLTRDPGDFRWNAPAQPALGHPPVQASELASLDGCPPYPSNHNPL